MVSASGHMVLRFFSLAKWKNSDQKKSLISKNHLNISAALPQLCSDFSPPVVNWGLGSRRQEQSQDGMRKPQPHLAKQQCSQPGMGERPSNRKVREGDTWHDTGGGGCLDTEEKPGREVAQLEKEQLHLGQSNRAARQRQDLGKRVNAAVPGEAPASSSSTCASEGCKHTQRAKRAIRS